MRIEIASRADALAFIRVAAEKTAVISITSTDEPDAVFPDHPNLTAILRIRCNDVTDAYDEEGVPYGRPVPKPEDFSGLRAFVSGLCCERLIVHCWEGVSRSAAIAAAIYEYRGCRDELRTRQRFSPNPLVYALARRALGVPEHDLTYAAMPGDGPERIVKRIP